MTPPAPRRLLFAGVPALLMVILGLLAVFGTEGVLRRAALQAELAAATANLAELERTNQRLILDLSTLEQDPVVIERAIADELGYARDGAVLYRFD